MGGEIPEGKQHRSRNDNPRYRVLHREPDLYRFSDTVDIVPYLYLNGHETAWQLASGCASINRTWQNGDEILIRLPMEPRKVKADKRVIADEGKVALQRGPVIYCLEAADQAQTDLKNMKIDDTTAIKYKYQEQLLNGIGTLTGMLGLSGETGSERTNQRTFLAVPYYSWANRKAAPMIVWIKEYDTVDSQ